MTSLAPVLSKTAQPEAAYAAADHETAAGGRLRTTQLLAGSTLPLRVGFDVDASAIGIGFSQASTARFDLKRSDVLDALASVESDDEEPSDYGPSPRLPAELPLHWYGGAILARLCACVP